ncbi:hypothetical protein GCM10028857_21420 [Salinarchaeum chitinilyticum]
MNQNHVHVGFVGGFAIAGNVRTLLENLRRLLRSQPTEFECDLLLADGESLPAGYRGIRIDAPPVNTARERITTLSRAIRRYVGRESPDVLVQLTKFPTHGTAVAIAGRLSGTPTITRLAGDNFREHKFVRGLGARAKTFALKNVIGLAAVHLPNAVIALGPQGRRDLAKRLRRRNVREIPQPIDREQFFPVEIHEREQIREELGMPALGDGRILLTVGRVSRRKGAETIRKVADELPSDIRWYVVGDGPMREELSSVDRVRAVGRVPHDRIADYYRAADLYVHPSLHDGLPNVLLEATACGTPSIARDVGECSTVATETFDDEDQLPGLVLANYPEPELPGRFKPDRLGGVYEDLLANSDTA